MGKTNPPFHHFRSAGQKLSYLLATWFGFGLSPIAPGTLGSIGALPLAYVLIAMNLHWAWVLGVIVSLLMIGIWASQVFCKISQTQDHQAIVVDEVVGLCLTSLPLIWVKQSQELWLLLALIIFRFFDIAKIPPVRAVDRWSKSGDSNNYWRAGAGVMLDDVLAGLQGMVTLFILLKALAAETFLL